GLIASIGSVQCGAGRPQRGSLTSLLGGLPGGTAFDPVPAAVDLEVQDGPGLGRRFGMVGTDQAGVARTGELAVEGEAQGVEQCGFAGPGGAVDQEQTGFGEIGEIDVNRAPEGTERGHLEVMWSHA